MSHLVIRSWTFLRNYTLMPAHFTTHTHTLSLYHTQVVLSDTATHTDTPSLYHTQIHTHPQSMTLLHTPTLFHFTTLRSYSRPHAFTTHTPTLFHFTTHRSYSVIRSRAFGNFTLMPLIDLMNHHPESRLAPTLMADGLVFFLTKQ